MVDGTRECPKDPICVCMNQTPMMCEEGEVSWEVAGEAYCVDPNSVTLADIINGQRQILAARENAQKAWETMPDSIKTLKAEPPIRVEHQFKEYLYATEKIVTFHFRDRSKLEIAWNDYKDYPFIHRGFDKLFPTLRLVNDGIQRDIRIKPAEFKKLNEHIY